MNQELQQFVRDALMKDIPAKKIDAALKQAGYDDEERKEALSLYADVDFPIPVPKRKPYMSAREAFLYLVMFATLYTSAWNVGSLLFQFIYRWIPDASSSYIYDTQLSTDAVRMATSALIVAFPVFLWVSWIVKRDIAKYPERRASKIRKWLTYATMFITSGIIIGDLIAVLYNFLNGMMTLRFGLQASVVGGIAAVIFGFYLNDLRGEESDK
jgi:hypothetical protein